jgi:putative transposase
MRKSYPSDLSDAQWDLIEPHIPPEPPLGAPRKVNMREIVKGILYINRTGVQWASLPHDLPPKSTVHYYYKQWRQDGTWDELLAALREQVRQKEGREPPPSMLIVDSQSVKTAGQEGRVTGKDAHKKINGRKRHIMVDTMGLVVMVLVTSAAIPDGVAVCTLMDQLESESFPRLKKILGENAYGRGGVSERVERGGRWILDIKDKDPEQVGLKVLKWRWVVERTIAWLGRYRRHSGDDEKLPASSRAMIQISSIHRMLQKLRPKRIDKPFEYPKKETGATI